MSHHNSDQKSANQLNPEEVTDPNSDKYFISHFSYLGRSFLNFFFFPASLAVFIFPTSKYENLLWNTKLNLSRKNTKPMDWLMGLGTYERFGQQIKPSREFQFVLDRMRSIKSLTPDLRDYYHYWIIRKTNKELFRRNPIQYMIRDNKFDLYNYLLNAYFLAVPAYFLKRFDILDVKAASSFFSQDSKATISDVFKYKNYKNLYSTPIRKLYWAGCSLFTVYSLYVYYVEDDPICAKCAPFSSTVDPSNVNKTQ